VVARRAGGGIKRATLDRQIRHAKADYQASSDAHYLG
jgi:hypothetical protein